MPTPRPFAPADLISLTRLPLAGAFVLAGDTVTRLAVVGIAGLTDWLDGWVARRGTAGRYGAVIDPAADRVFVVAVIAALVVENAMTLAQCLLLLVRDIATTLGAAAVRLAPSWRPPRLQARWSGKVVTALQFVTLLAVIVQPSSMRWLLPLVVLASGASIVDYARVLRRAHLHAALIAAFAGSASGLQAQEGSTPSIRPLARIDAFLADVDVLHVGGGVTRELGRYVRLDGVLAAGVARARGETLGSGRAEVVGRFLLDPFLQSRWGFHGGGGIIARLDEGADPRGYITLLFGAELPNEGRWRPAIEIGIGGGTRIALVVRRGAPDRR